MKPRAALLVLLTALGSLARQGDPPPAPAPELEDVCDLAGHAVRLAEARGHALLLFFHASSARYSLEGLDALVERLHALPELAAQAPLWVLSASEDEARTAAEHLAPLGATARALVDPKRNGFRTHAIVAMPTVMCLDAHSAVLVRVQGFGALFAQRAELGARLATGELTREDYERRLAGGESAAGPDPREVRERILVHRMLESGQLVEAEQRLVELVPRFPRAAWPRVLSLRCALLRGRLDEARSLAQALAEIWPESPERRYAEALLLEQAGDPEAAAAAYRRVLEECLFGGGS